MSYYACEPSPNEGCVDGSKPDQCSALCDWRIGYEAVGSTNCVKR